MQPAIDLRHIDVTFHNKNKTVHAVQDVSLEVEPGDIYGIVGYSGAGKSTLVRVINMLQKPTSGQVIVNGHNMETLKAKELRAARRKIGMIFQHFNLMNERTIAANVAFPLQDGPLSKQERHEKVAKLLELVELSDKANSYPSQLSGGQKQRVAIARALANDPEILISDEATSALDPKTTLSILKLLQSLNQRLGLTVVLITHEMDAVKEVCNKVAVMENGRIIERGSLLELFSHPKEKLTRDFIETSTQINQALPKILAQDNIKHLQPGQVLVKLAYQGANTDEPLISGLYQHYEVAANILYGNIEILQQTPIGHLVVVLSGTPDHLDDALENLRTDQVTVEILKQPEEAHD
ncbi:ABC-type metal ion transport system, ATPase component [Lactobacillus selangorensis]|uniref:ABC-type metal ion transport system, ATPase component n=1 Tax=Lactobacillus selangorensis TaxID=81857 RepID=A0A0R2G7D6_9LACO|nr:ATP-binding cassette domain-containing protein [Lactobacillus selangorensis]KRN29322.1 ABC-type metal ion transport system, ATPase component [Lactobacillus selangorensis]KRN34149.1 ABC-type metal ion transport system, ATPase component [Lactobacillus selangorensis]